MRAGTDYARLERARPRYTPFLELASSFWTRPTYEDAKVLGVFDPEEPCELIDGELLQKMPQNAHHATGINLALEVLREVFGEGYSIRVQQPLSIDEFSQPEPDIAVVIGHPRIYEEEHPRTAVLVVEVSDTTLAMDRQKATLYARVHVGEYWILDLAARELRVFREPTCIEIEDEHYDPIYRYVVRYSEDDAIALLAAPHRTIRVADLLPNRRP